MMLVSSQDCHIYNSVHIYMALKQPELSSQLRILFLEQCFRRKLLLVMYTGVLSPDNDGIHADYFFNSNPNRSLIFFLLKVGQN